MNDDAIPDKTASAANPQANPEGSPPARAQWSSDQLTKAATVLGAFFAAGQTGSQLVEGHYGHQIELAKLEQDRVLARQKSDSDLATQFLALILAKDTSDENRSLLYDALSTLQNHPLQAWAKARHSKMEKDLANLEQTRGAQLAAASDAATQEVDRLQTQIQELAAQIELHREDTDRTEKLHIEQIDLVQKLSFAKAAQSKANALTIQVAGATVSLGEARIEKSVVAFSVPIDRLRPALTKPDGSKLYDAYMPFIEAALVEYKLTEPRMAAAVIATAALETDLFSTVVEYGSGKEYEGNKALGNDQPGDGERFKGRGLVLLTGRANYATFSQRLGLGTLLTDSPDDANKPEIASRILCDYFKEKEPQFSKALAGADPDLMRVRRLVSGGSNGLDRFAQLYRSTLAALDGTRSTK